MDDIQYKKNSMRMDSDRMLHLPNEDDLLFYLEYWQEFPDTFKRVAEKEIEELENKIKNKKK